MRDREDGYGTPFIESEAILAVSVDDMAYAKKMVGQMSLVETIELSRFCNKLRELCLAHYGTLYEQERERYFAVQRLLGVFTVGARLTHQPWVHDDDLRDLPPGHPGHR